MRLRSLAAVAAATLALAAAVLPGTAAAAPMCSVVAPTKVVVDRAAQAVPFRLSSNCRVAHTDWSQWNIVKPSRGYGFFLPFDGGATSTVWSLDDSAPTGDYIVRDLGARDTDGAPVAQNSPWLRVKLGPRLSVTPDRTGGALTLWGRATTWSPAFGRWYPRAGAKVSVIYQAPGASTWRWVTATTSSSTGRVRLSVARREGRYRLLVKETATVWSAHSSIVSVG